ncbi:hypothetical protein LZ32DRAFT_265889 [Colletotrichum eremochloae]|nr:hypothetical protein LZ32DRAFT_265889 [Colletotrichum eremochloae]
MPCRSVVETCFFASFPHSIASPSSSTNYTSAGVAGRLSYSTFGAKRKPHPVTQLGSLVGRTPPCTPPQRNSELSATNRRLDGLGRWGVHVQSTVPSTFPTCRSSAASLSDHHPASGDGQIATNNRVLSQMFHSIRGRPVSSDCPLPHARSTSPRSPMARQTTAEVAVEEAVLDDSCFDSVNVTATEN